MFSSQNSQVSSDANYIEDVFSTYLYTGTGATQTITNGIDLAGKGGLTWFKRRDNAANHALLDTARGVNKYLESDGTGAQITASPANMLTSFNAAGFTLGADTSTEKVNAINAPMVSWTFREQPKFFDVVTYTGNGTSSKAVSHNLGSVPGCMIVKKTSASGTDWSVYHRSLGNGGLALLNDTVAAFTSNSEWAFTTPTSTEFYVNGVGGDSNANGATYVAYLFAHDAGGFGLTGTDNVISCGSYAGTGAAGNIVTLGYEPQWLMIKRIDSAQVWTMYDNMRGIVTGGNDPFLIANYSDAETTGTNFISVNATGFSLETLDQQVNSGSGTYIYIAIRRGPMKVPTSGTSVFAPSLTTTNNTITTNFPVDLSIFKADKTTTSSNLVFDRLRGNTARLVTSTTGAEATATAYPLFDNNTGTAITGFSAGLSGIDWAFRRAPSFFDEVCVTGTGSDLVANHNLGVAPELVIFKTRSGAGNWDTYCAYNSNANGILRLNSTLSGNNTDLKYVLGDGTSVISPTSTTMTLFGGTFTAGATYVAYLFATCAGVSKVGSYTGTGTTLQVNCGFTGGARFVLIKRTDSTGDWYVWDSARGIVAGNDPYLLMNSSAAEVTNTDYVDTYSAGFEISSTAPAAINASGGTFIFLAIA